MIAAAADRAAFAASDLPTRLRAETAEAHDRLEVALAIEAHAADRGWMVGLLQRFHGFHRVWEPAVAARLDPAFEFDRRRRLALIEVDLIGLGVAPDAIARLPLCLAARGLGADAAAALGSLYVMEGSTLGGQVIARALAGQPWIGAAGIGYFQPYGPRTGGMWRRLREELGATGLDHDAIVAGAQRTFGLLLDWLAPGRGT